MGKNMEFNAIFDCESNSKYRYSLTRKWDECLPKATIIMLNPSVANVLKNDLSINRCLNYCIDNNYGSLEVINLFAFIETDSKKLKASPEYIGEKNDYYIEQAINQADKVIVGWGSDNDYRTRKKEVWNKFLKDTKVYYFEDDSNRTPPVHISRLAKGFYLKEYKPKF